MVQYEAVEPLGDPVERLGFGDLDDDAVGDEAGDRRTRAARRWRNESTALVVRAPPSQVATTAPSRAATAMPSASARASSSDSRTGPRANERGTSSSTVTVVPPEVCSASGPPATISAAGSRVKASSVGGVTVKG